MTTTTLTTPPDDGQFAWDFHILQSYEMAEEEDLSLELDRFFDEICEPSGLQDEDMEEVLRSNIPNARSNSPQIPTADHLSLFMAGTGLMAPEHATMEDSSCHIASSSASFAVQRRQNALTPQSQEGRSSDHASRDASADLDALENDSTTSSIAEQQECASVDSSLSEHRRSRSRSISASSICSLPSLPSVLSSACPSKPCQQDEATEFTQESPQVSILEREERSQSFPYSDWTADEKSTFPTTLAATIQTSGFQTPEAKCPAANGLSDSPSKQSGKKTKSRKRKRNASPGAEDGAPLRRSARERLLQRHWYSENIWICQARDTIEELIAENRIQVDLAKARRERLLKECDAEISRLETAETKLSAFMGNILVWGEQDQQVGAQL